ncbi:MAG: histidine phosphatase family protein [Oscillospiraceae bacterium]|jgi:broad specificity phosphatase PhoE|nr:histidine phosphatase family protein [Oscillospiraceae bacterium]
MKIFAARHGQTDWNAEGRIQGITDIPLNETGRAQARGIAEELFSRGISEIISSPLLRAVETAEIIADQIGTDKTKIVRDPRLRERNFGVYEGKLIAETDILTLRRWSDNAPVPRGETIRELAERVFCSVDDAVAKFKGRNILFVVHGQVIRTMLWYFNGTPGGGEEPAFEVENCAVYEFDC